MTSPPSPPALKGPDDLEALLERSERHPVMLFKHSTRCPVSSFAYREYLDYARTAAERGVECAVVLVVEDRPVSLQAAEALGVRHQSPQAILIEGRAAVWDASHEAISSLALERAETALRGRGAGAPP